MASEYHRGEMDISEQTATYAVFMALTKWGTPAGFIPGAISAVVVTVIGILVLRDKPGAGH